MQTQKLQTKVELGSDAKHSKDETSNMESKRVQSTTLAYCEQRVMEYLDKCKQANISLPTLPGLEQLSDSSPLSAR